MEKETKGGVKGKELFEKLSLKKKPVWDKLTAEETAGVFAFSEGYKKFLDRAKTEREAVDEIHHLAMEAGFVDLQSNLNSGFDHRGFYQINRGKNIALIVLGNLGPCNGARMIFSHIDSPRLDLKPNPLCEKSGMAFLRTHYYGGIKKYQWVCRSLAIHGKIVKADGTELYICVGENEADPVFMVADLLPHLAKTQKEKKMPEIVEGEKLKVIIGSMPLGDSEMSERLKFHILDYLFEHYGIAEEDFTSAEIEIVPSDKARDVGFDRSMVGAYGQDDRACAYTSLRAVLSVEPQAQKYTSVVFFLDKEEIGSEGNTGAQSVFLEEVLTNLLAKTGYDYNESYLRRAISVSSAISADVTAAVDPDWEEVHEIQNAALLGYGVGIEKYTGSGGKYSASDANAEYVGKIRRILNEAGVVWQAGELGRVDLGGGGTIAMYLAKRGMDVIDIGVPVVAMHSPFEITSKADIYMAFKAYQSFLKSNL